MRWCMTEGGMGTGYWGGVLLGVWIQWGGWCMIRGDGVYLEVSFWGLCGVCGIMLNFMFLSFLFTLKKTNAMQTLI